MATRPNIAIPANTWTDVYAALNAQTGFPSVTVGTSINIQNLSGGDIRVTEKAAPPTNGDGFRRAYRNIVTNNVSSGSPGVWVYSSGEEGLINVEVN